MKTLLSIKTLAWSLVCMIVLISLLIHGPVYAAADGNYATAQLSVTPKPCVALRKGQTCYLEVTFNWQHPTMNNYCLVNVTTNKTMKCWEQQANGEFSFDFQSSMSHDFALRQQASTIDIVSTTIPVAWVYQSSKRAKSTWRLF